MVPPINHKRKRLADHSGKPKWKQPTTGEDGEVVQDPEQQEASLKAYMFHANKLLQKACKKAKTFEVQKLTKKIKSTREPKEGKEVDQTLLTDLEAQLVALKALSIDSIPPHLLSSRLPKLPVLRQIPFVPSILSSIPSSSWTELPGQSAEGKARNRILANKSIAEGWEEVVRAVMKRMGEEVEPSKLKEEKIKVDPKGKGKEVENLSVPTTVGVTEGGVTGEKRLSKRAERARKAEETKKNLPKRTMEMSEQRKALLETAGSEAVSEEGLDGGFESGEDDDEGPLAGSEDEELDDDEIARELAALDGEGDGSEGDWSGSEEDEEEEDTATRPTKRSKPSLSLSPSPPPAKKRSIREREPHKPVTSSAFLPSLAAGYVSYSDSDGEDAKWVKEAERENKKGERKNRRGQRARQAIWEKKYGSAAAHVVKQSGGKPVPLDKLKKNKKAIKNGTELPAPPPRSTEPEKPFNPANAPGGSANPNAQPVAPRKAGYGPAAAKASSAPAEKMHPSWEAKRKAAEALKTSQPQGKKITFD